MKKLLLLACICTGCASSNPEEIVKISYFHEYGPQVQEQEWKARGSSGDIVTIRRDGSFERREYQHGVLHGTCSWSFPHSKMIARVEEYDHGTLTLIGTNYPSGVSQYQKQLYPHNRHIITYWYEEGSPRSIEEYNKDLLTEAQYFNEEGDLEAQVHLGNGTRLQRADNGDLWIREKIVNGQVMLHEKLFANKHVQESISYLKGKQHGPAKHFSANEEPLSIENWEQGELHGNTLLFEHGKLVQQIPFVHGKKEGRELQFSPGTEKIVAEISWLNNMRHGPSYLSIDGHKEYQWFWKGQAVSEDQYNNLHTKELVPHTRH